VKLGAGQYKRVDGLRLGGKLEESLHLFTSTPIEVYPQAIGEVRWCDLKRTRMSAP
jgi:hypothetical protein